MLPLIRHEFRLPSKLRLYRNLFVGLFVFGITVSLCQELFADVVVINNRTKEAISIDREPYGQIPPVKLPPGSSKAFLTDSNLAISVTSRAGTFQQTLQSNAIYYYGETTGGLRKISLTKNDGKQPNANLIRKRSNPPTIRLAVYVDEEEAMTDRQWQNRLAKRIHSASEVLEYHIGVKLEVVSFNRWQSDNKLRDLEPLLADFERKVRPPVGTVAVGFSSQLHIHPTIRRTMGGTRGPLRSHLIVKEWAPRVSEVERTEILLHEIGHYLGASHSPEQNSVMRPVLASSTTRLKSQPIQFDPLNTFVMAIVSQELASRSIRRLDQLTPSDRILLAGVYKTIGELMPQDPASPRMLQKVQLDRIQNQAQRNQGLEEAIRSTLNEITKVATLNRKLPHKGNPSQLRGDDLADLYIRTAASHIVRQGLKESIQSEAFIYSLALAFDRSDRLKNFDFFDDLATKSDPEKNRRLRMNVMGLPTARGREDTLLHFIDSAALSLLFNTGKARFLGFAKEALDAQPGGSGFSFTDIAANEAGIRFANQLIDSKLPLNTLANRFETDLFIPTMENLPEDLSEEEYLKNYGGLGDERNEAMLEEIRHRLDRLPPYLKLELNL